MTFQHNKPQKLGPYDIVEKSLNLDIFEATDFLLKEGYLNKGNLDHKQDSFLCTYHDEKTPSLTRDKRYKSMKCWGCGIIVKPVQIYADFLIKERLSGNCIYLPQEQQTLEKNFIRWEAAIYLCYNLGEISATEKDYQFEQLENQKKLGKCTNFEFLETSQEIIGERAEVDGIAFVSRKSNKGESSIEIAQNKIEEFKNLNIATREELHIVYSLFRDAVEIVRGYRLFEKHKKHLMEDRRLSEIEINLNGYFSHPLEHEKKAIMQCLINLLNKNGRHVDILKKVPGFNWNCNTGSIEIGTQYDDAFFIPLIDIWGNIHREQLRTNGKTKYLWYVVKGAGNCKTPTSTLFPFNKNYMDLIRGNMNPNNNLQECFSRYYNQKGVFSQLDWTKEVIIIISEGHFKSYELAKHFNCICISIQGLNTWDCSIIALIKIQNMLKMYNKRITKIIIAFDSDTRVKKGLFDNGAALSQLIRNENSCPEGELKISFLDKIECFYLEWDDELGKGFDDVKHNGYNNDVFNITLDTDYEHKHRTITSLISKLLRKQKSSLTTDELSNYYSKLSKNNILELENKLNRINLIDSIIHARFKEQIHQLDSNVISNVALELNQKSVIELQQIKQSFS